MKYKSIFVLAGLLALALPACSLDLGGNPTPVSNAITVPTSASTNDVLFQDDFSNSDSGWETGDYSGDTLSYLNGTYDIYSQSEGSVLWGVAGQNFTDLVLDVDATQVSGPEDNNNAYGVYCRRTGEDYSDAYAFFISGDGYYSIIKITGGEFTPLVDWDTSDAINLGDASNHLKASCVGDELTFWVNGTQVADTHDSTYTSGDIALAAGSMETTGTEVQFDNIVVTTP